jgi:hypothetical protein
MAIRSIVGQAPSAAVRAKLAVHAVAVLSSLAASRRLIAPLARRGGLDQQEETLDGPWSRASDADRPGGRER